MGFGGQPRARAASWWRRRLGAGIATSLVLLTACQPAPSPRPTPPAQRLPPATPTAAPTGQPRVSTPVDPRRTFLGIDEGIRNDALLAETGATWQRVVIPWSAVQPSGPGDVSRLGQVLPMRVITAQVDRGVRIAGLLQFTPRWAQTNPAQGERSPPRNLDLPFDDPNNYFARFVFETVQFFAGTIDEWIIWNEPEFKPGEPGVGESYTWLGSDAQYAQLLKVGYLAARAANPNALVSFAGTSYWTDEVAHRPQFYDRVLDILKRDPLAERYNAFHDALSVNLYRAPDDLVRVHGVFKAIQARHGLDQPIWLTETNAMPTDDRQIACSHADQSIQTTMEQQAAFAVQAFGLAAATGYRRVGFYQMVDGDPCRQPAAWGAARDDGTRRPVADALRTVFGTFGNFRQARFVPLARLHAAWPAWPDDPRAAIPNWEVYQVALDLPDQRRVTHVWNGDGQARCVGIRKSGVAVRAIDKRGALQLEPAEREGWWWVSLAPATAHAPDDPDGYYFIGGDPLVLIENGVPAATPVVEPATGCVMDGRGVSLEKGFVVSLSPAGGQTVPLGKAADFTIASRGLAGFSEPISLRVAEWSTQRFPTARPPADLPLKVTLPASVRPGQRATVHVETAGGAPGIYFIAIEAAAGPASRRVELALVLE